MDAGNCKALQEEVINQQNSGVRQGIKTAIDKSRNFLQVCLIHIAINFRLKK
jgi:hypothetical protein